MSRVKSDTESTTAPPGSECTLTRSSDEMEMKARFAANLTSVGSSPTSSVFVTTPEARSTMLIESERLLTTHASESVRAFTVTGSRPTGIVFSKVRLPSAATVNTSSNASGVLTTSNRSSDGVRSSG